MPQPVATLRVAESLRDRNPRRRHLENEAAASVSRAQYGEPLMRLPASPQTCLDLRGEEEKQLGAFFSDEEAEVEEDEDGRRRRSLQPYATLSSTSSVSAMTTPRHQPTIFMAYCRAVIQIVSARPSVMPGMPLSGRGQVSGMVSRGGG